MNIRFLPIALLLALGPIPAHAGVSIQLNIGIPAGPPPLVEVAPGIQVVEGCPEEVFFSAGWYWCRRPEGWYRARSPRVRFDCVDARYVPPGMRMRPAGYYRNWHRGRAEGRMRPEVRERGRGHGERRGPEHDR